MVMIVIVVIVVTGMTRSAVATRRFQAAEQTVIFVR